MSEPEEIEDISSASEVGGSNLAPDAQAKKEAEQISNESKKESLRSQKNDNDARVLYANRIFCLIAVWLGAIFLILFLQGTLGKEGMPFDWTFGPNSPRGTGIWHFDLPPEIILALIGSTTATVLGLFAVVAHYLFPEKR